MKNTYINSQNVNGVIEGVILRKLIIHKDPSGSLVETLRSDWADVFNKNELNFSMQYVSTTPSGIARDEEEWHVHQFQLDRFICISGRIVTAIYDPREESPTKGKLNLFVMGPQNEEEMYMLIIPKKTYHGFIVISEETGSLANFPTQLYNPKDEGRIKNNEFSWETVRADFLKK